MSFVWRVCAGLALILGTSLACAEAVNPRIQQVMSSPDALQKAQHDGKKAAAFCANCHGNTGNSTYDYIPNLAGQHPGYLFNQIKKFADGRRQDRFMSGLIKAMKDEDRFNMAIYYANQRVQAARPPEPDLVARGRQLYSQECKSCHGEKGYGGENIARLAGQRPGYLVEALGKYQNGIKRRADPVMSSVARRLQVSDIAALANYIVTMK